MASLRQIAWLVARDVTSTVGGGIAAMELLRRNFIARGWMDDHANAIVVAVSRLTPGTNILAYCTAAGWVLRGWRGSAAALAAPSVPSALIIYALSAVVVRLIQYRGVRAVLAVGMLVAAALIFSTAWALLRPFIRSGRRVRVFAFIGGTLALSVIGLTPVRVLLLSAAAGALVPTRPAAPQPKAIV
jgi:chromate transporter